MSGTCKFYVYKNIEITCGHLMFYWNIYNERIPVYSMAYLGKMLQIGVTLSIVVGFFLAIFRTLISTFSFKVWFY